VGEVAGAAALLAELAADLADQVTRRYRVDRADAASAILDGFSRQPKLLAAVETANSAADVRRTRAYRDAAVATKRGIYQQLRRYLPEPASFDDPLAALACLPAGAAREVLAEAILAVAAAHVSTAERLPCKDEFLAKLATIIGGAVTGSDRVAVTGAGGIAETGVGGASGSAARDGTAAGAGGTVVDVGCGVFPLVLPVGWLAGLGVREYWALDKDSRAQAAVAEYARIAPDRLIRPVEWNIATGWAPLLRAGLPGSCDVGLLLKVVPVVARQSPELLAVLASTPADRLLISGSRVAMAKRQDIERRELRTILRFCAAHGLRQADEFRTPDETFLLVERG